MSAHTALLSALCLSVAALALPVAAQPVVAAYYFPGGGKPDALKRPSTTKLTHLIYAFVPVCGDSPAFDADEKKQREPLCNGVADYALTLPDTDAMRAELKAMAELKARDPDLRIIASVGGWGMPMFPEIVAQPERRQVFTRSTTAFLTRYPVFDGIDIDWEYPGGGDEARAPLGDDARRQEAADHRALIEGLRVALDGMKARDGRERLLTTAVAGSMIGEVGALGGGFLPNAMGQSLQHTGSYFWGFVAFALLAVAMLVMLRIVQIRWTRTWAEKGGRARTTTGESAPAAVAPRVTRVAPRRRRA